MRLKKFFAAVFAAVSLFSCFSCAENYEYEYLEKDSAVFSGAMTLYVKLLGRDASSAFEEMSLTLEKIGSEISLTDKNSALSYFNEKAEENEKVKVSKETYNLISLALGFEKETGGAFSIGAFNLSELWGLDVDGYSGYDPFEDIPVKGELPDYETQVLSAKAHCDTSRLILTQEAGECFIEKSDGELKIDLGGIAKGYCADLCVGIAKRHSLKSALINISGNIVLLGGYYDGRKFVDWEISVLQPRPKAALYREEVCAFGSGGDISIVTSGDYRRYYRHESDLQLCHIIDPISGLPTDISLGADGKSYVQKPEIVSSATVLCGSSAAADAYSTALCVMGLENAARFLQENNDVCAIIFTERGEAHGRMYASDGIEFIKEDTYGEFRKYEKYAPA